MEEEIVIIKSMVTGEYEARVPGKNPNKDELIQLLCIRILELEEDVRDAALERRERADR